VVRRNIPRTCFRNADHVHAYTRAAIGARAITRERARSGGTACRGVSNDRGPAHSGTDWRSTDHKTCADYHAGNGRIDCARTAIAAR
jgi:hypothetical protein